MSSVPPKLPRSAMASPKLSFKDSEDAKSGPQKAVSIAANTETITLPLPAISSSLEDDTELRGMRQHRAKVGRRYSNHHRPQSSHASQSSLTSQSSQENDFKESGHTSNHHLHLHSGLLHQVSEWLQEEKRRRSARRAQRLAARGAENASPEQNKPLSGYQLSKSESSEGLDDLETLEKILTEHKQNEIHAGGGKKSPLTLRNKGPLGGHRPSISSRKTKRPPSVVGADSDTEYFDGDIVVPSVDASLDNSKTLGYSRGAGDSTLSVHKVGVKAAKEKEAWTIFKNEILRLAHTLRLKGWRRVPLEGGEDIIVERLSGALTNAVYVVYPPKNMPNSQADGTKSPKKPPMELILRIYGPAVEHLIDRESELQILRRLARKRIGPRMLGTFKNGRFEQYLRSKTLTAPDLRNPDISSNIAKRMRELHEGIELLEEERDAGPFVWRSWDKWVERCEHIVTWLDLKISTGTQGPARTRLDRWKERGFVCGVPWPLFRRTVEGYRSYILKKYNGLDNLRRCLVFAHNDTQYGNILRLEPSGESPLLLPANEHKQLVVIDFEYASANAPGLDIANHFTEWCYNYRNREKPYAMNTSAYPTPKEQRRFIRAYLNHRPSYWPQTASTSGTPGASPAGSLQAFNLDSRSPGVALAREAQAQADAEKEVEKLVEEVRIWRVANSAQWVAWGIVQAKVHGMEDENVEVEEVSLGEEESDEFDYLAYAQDRALFFWGDVVNMGIVKREDLPPELVSRLKRIDF
ncbi:MAG: hypothetical protein M1829_005170 [Trizodia sp. TS-e1964]|nr:MAG: hypothetical protein M1829_005170 [Trizodia sp. TS-e1964]